MNSHAILLTANESIIGSQQSMPSSGLWLAETTIALLAAAIALWMLSRHPKAFARTKRWVRGGHRSSPGEMPSGFRGSFVAVASGFAGCYEAIHSISIHRQDAARYAPVLLDWEDRIEVCGDPDILEAWRNIVSDVTGTPLTRDITTPSNEAIAEIADRWCRLLTKCGIHRDKTPGPPTFTLSLRDRYHIDGHCKNGDAIEILRACWLHDGQVLERGLAKALDTVK